MKMTNHKLTFLPDVPQPPTAAKAGFRFGDTGTHSSRTLMFGELAAVLAAAPQNATRDVYAQAIVEANCLGKPTTSTRRASNQRLGELFALDLSSTVFRVLRRLWDLDPPSRPLSALLVALARDPLLRASAPLIIALPAGAELQRGPFREAFRTAVGERFNDAVLDKVLRNVASTWTQTGHLSGRTFKVRKMVKPTPPTVAFALFLAHACGFRGASLFSSGWVAVLDCTPPVARELAFEAKRVGLIDLRIAGEVVDLVVERLDPRSARS